MTFQIGEQVTVQWYGQSVDGVVEENHADNPLLGSMIVVRIPVQGVKVLAMFMPAHVCRKVSAVREPDHVTAPQPAVQAQPVADRSTRQQPSDAWQRLQEFKQAHWNQAKNHLQLDALDAFYDLWWHAVAEKSGYTGPTMRPRKSVPVDAIQQLAKKMIERDCKIEQPAPEPVGFGMPPIEYHRPEKPIQVTQLELFG